MTLAAQFTPTGPLIPSYADIFAAIQIQVQAIYGSDTDLDPDTQDGQFLAIFAQALSDANQVALAVYQSFAPSTAQGPGLSQMVLLNGLQRNTATDSVVTLTITGQQGAVINKGLVGDNQNLGTIWALPNQVTIPAAGTINVQATSTTLGAIAAAVNTLTVILTPTIGWQSVNNATAATTGLAVETDFELRQRQQNSVSNTATGPVDAIQAAVANVNGVTRLVVLENTSDITDTNGNISHSIAVVTQGGDPVAIAAAIASKKPAGTGMNGNTTVLVTDPMGVQNFIKFFTLTLVTINVQFTINALTGFVNTTTTLIQEALAEYLSTLPIGTDSYLDNLFNPANLSGTAAVAATGMTQAQLDAISATYKIQIGTMQQWLTGNSPAAADIVIAFNQAAVSVITNITITVA